MFPEADPITRHWVDKEPAACLGHQEREWPMLRHRFLLVAFSDAGAETKPKTTALGQTSIPWLEATINPVGPHQDGMIGRGTTDIYMLITTSYHLQQD